MYKVKIDGNTIYNAGISADLAIIDPKLELEVNNAGEFEFIMSPTHPLYGSVKRLSSVVTVEEDGSTIFEGRVTEEKTDFWKRKTYHCEGCLAYLKDTKQPPAEYHNLTVRQYLGILLNVHNSKVTEDKQFELGAVTVTDSNNSLYRYTNWESTLQCINDDLLKSLGGYLRIRYEDGKKYLDYLAAFPNTNSQIIRFGRNLLDYASSYDSSDYCTVLIPQGAELEESPIPALHQRLSIEDVNGGSPYLVNADAVAEHGWIEKVIEWDGVHVATTLLRKGKKYLEDVQFDSMVLSIKAIDLHKLNPEIESIKLMDEIRAISKPHGMDRVFPVTKVSIPLDSASGAEYTLGTKITQSLTSTTEAANEDILNRIKRAKTPQEILESAQDNASALIKSALNGYVVITDDASELLVMDTPDINTAKKVWRWNVNGLGYSNNGYDGKYGLALTMDGAIVADFITTGTLNANLLRAGKIEDAQGYNYWDLQTGDFHLLALQDYAKKANTIVDTTPQYAVGTSFTEAPTSGWSTETPTWEEGKYIWFRLQMVNGNNEPVYSEAVCVQGAKGENGVSVSSQVPQYYLSESSVTQTGGMWTEDEPTWESGFYIWSRLKIQWSSGVTTYTSPVLAKALNGANQKAASAESTAATAESTANSASETASNAQFTADSATTAAARAQTTANTANTNAGRAQSTANAASTKADAAQSTANTASTKADTAQSTAEGAQEAVTALDQSLYTEEIFNRLTNNGAVQGIVMDNGNLYVNASYINTGTLNADLIKSGTINADLIKSGTINADLIKSGTINADLIKSGTINANLIKSGTIDADLIRAGKITDSKGYNYWDLDTGEFSLAALSNYATNSRVDAVEATAQDAAVEAETAKSVADALDKSLDSAEVFKRLTNNGKVKGITMSEGNLYINASYINSGVLNAGLMTAGIITDKNGVNYWNLDTGEFSLSALSSYATKSEVQTAQETAEAAQTTAEAAQTTANSASTTATTAKTTADSAKTTADSAKTTATTAKNTADDAVAAVEELDESLKTEEIFNRLTNNGKIKGITMSNGNLYVNATYINSGYLSANRIHGGTLKLGGSNNTYGKISIYDASGTLKGTINSGGISAQLGQFNAINIDNIDGDNSASITLNSERLDIEAGTLPVWVHNLHTNQLDVTTLGATNAYITYDNVTNLYANYVELTGDFVWWTSTAKANYVFAREVRSSSPTGYTLVIPDAQIARLSFQPWNPANASTYYRPVASYGTNGNRVNYISAHSSSHSVPNSLGVNAQYGSTSAYSTKNFAPSSSDIRLKENVKDCEIEALPFIQKIRMRQFDWKENGVHQDCGFIADELEQLDRNLSIGGGYEEDGTMNEKSVNDFYLLGYMVKAMQEMQAEIDYLKGVVKDGINRRVD